MFSGTNLLTSCSSARCLFSAVFGFRKVSKEIFSEGRDKGQSELLFVGNKKSRGEPEGLARRARPTLGTGSGGPAPG